MDKIGALDAKTHLAKLLERVAAGESFLITRRGSPVARLLPVNQTASEAAAKTTLARFRALRKRAKPGPSIREMVTEGRRS